MNKTTKFIHIVFQILKKVDDNEDKNITRKNKRIV